MSVVLSPVGNDAPFLDASGNPLSGGLLYFYTAGTTTPQDTYTTSAGSTPNANPVVLDSGGYPATGGSVGEIWFTNGVTYKAVLKTSAGVTVWTRDNLSGINDSGVALSAATQAQQESGILTTVYVSPARQQYHPSAPKAWGAMRYDGGGFQGSYNAASITDSGTGQLSFVATNAFSSASTYAVVGLLEAGGTALLLTCQRSSTTTITTLTQTPGGVATDATACHLAMLGDQ